MENIHTLIIPDVHGRTFWKYAIQQYPIEKYPDIKIIFLGDYLDPYTSFEGITKNEAIMNFVDIIDIAKKDNRIVLLLGNHDYHYLYHNDNCRIDLMNYDTIKHIFNENIDMFNIAYEENINNKTYLYTHAGVTQNWLNIIKTNIDKILKELTDEEKQYYKNYISSFKPNSFYLNRLSKSKYGINLLFMISHERGGWHRYGSCIWADIHEHFYDGAKLEDDNIFQIFGHTLGYPELDKEYIDYDKNIAMLDSRCAWILTNDEKFYNI